MKNDTHFAVNKGTNLIVFGWDYSDVEPSDLRQFKKDYFITDLKDNEFDPKQYKILTRKSCEKLGIDPDNQMEFWSNRGELPLKDEKNQEFEITESEIRNLVKGTLMNLVQEEIKIKPENKGKFTATKKRTGKSTEELTHSKNPITKKRAIFAQNAKKWSHKKNKTNEAYDRLGWQDDTFDKLEQLKELFNGQETELVDRICGKIPERSLNGILDELIGEYNSGVGE